MGNAKLTVIFLAWVVSGVAFGNVTVTSAQITCPVDGEEPHYDPNDYERSWCCKILTCDRGKEPQICQEGKPDTTKCYTCRPGFYSDKPVYSNSGTSCRQHERCKEGTIQVTPGNNTHNIRCACDNAKGYFNEGSGQDLKCVYRHEWTCKEGTQYEEESRSCMPCPDGTYRNSTSDRKCRAYTPCGVGQNETFPGNATHDRECFGLPIASSSKEANSPLQLELIIPLAILAFVCVLLIAFIMIKKGCKRQQQTVVVFVCDLCKQTYSELQCNDIVNTNKENGRDKRTKEEAGSIYKIPCAPLLGNSVDRQMSDKGYESDIDNAETSSYASSKVCDNCRKQIGPQGDDGNDIECDGAVIGDDQQTELKTPLPADDWTIDLVEDGVPPSGGVKSERGKPKLLIGLKDGTRCSSGGYCHGLKAKRNDSEGDESLVTVNVGGNEDYSGSRTGSDWDTPDVHRNSAPLSPSTSSVQVFHVYGNHARVQVGNHNNQSHTVDQDSTSTMV